MNADLELVLQAKQGSRNAFSELVQRHQKSMMRVALRVVRDWNQAEDIVQESFIKAYTSLPGFEGRSSFRSWMYQITLNTARNRIRSLGREVVGLDQYTIGVESDPNHGLHELDVKKVLQEEIAKLPARQQLALQLRIFEDLSFKEVAEIMQCPYDTAKANYRHAILKLKERLQGEVIFKEYGENNPVTWVEFTGRLAEVDA